MLYYVSIERTAFITFSILQISQAVKLKFLNCLMEPMKIHGIGY